MSYYKECTNYYCQSEHCSCGRCVSSPLCDECIDENLTEYDTIVNLQNQINELKEKMQLLLEKNDLH